MAAEDVAVGGASLLDGVLQGAGNVLLSDDLGEFLRTIFAGQDGVTHGRKTRLYAKTLTTEDTENTEEARGVRSKLKCPVFVARDMSGFKVVPSPFGLG